VQLFLLLIKQFLVHFVYVIVVILVKVYHHIVDLNHYYEQIHNFVVLLFVVYAKIFIKIKNKRKKIFYKHTVSCTCSLNSNSSRNVLFLFSRSIRNNVSHSS